MRVLRGDSLADFIEWVRLRTDLDTVAEGVEVSGQAVRLRGMDCDMLQGYVFSRPVPVAEFEKMLFGE